MKTPILALLVFAAAISPLFAQPPLLPPALPRWQFTPERTLAYDVDHVMTLNSTGDKTTTMNESGSIKMLTLSQNAGLELYLEVNRSTIQGFEVPPRNVAALPKTEYASTLLPDGRIENKGEDAPSNVQLMLDFSFPLPEKTLFPGKPVSQEMFMKSGSNLKDLSGNAVFTHEGYEKIDGADYLKYRVDCALKSPEIPKGETNVMRATLNASMHCLFDEKKGQFYSVTSDMNMNMTMTGADTSKKFFSDQHHLVEIRLVTDSTAPRKKK